MDLSWALLLVVTILVMGYGLYTVYNLSNLLGDYLRS
jgi:hypothetical protein